LGSEWKQWEDLPPEEEQKIIERMATFFVKHKMGLVAQMILESGGPLTSLFAEFWMGLYGPYFDFLGVDKYMAIMRKKKNLKKILERIDELETGQESKKPQLLP